MYYVYMVECADSSLYTGCTNNLERRLRMHNSGAGAKYTRSRRPVRLVYQEQVEGHSLALRREAAIKGLTRREKLELIARAGEIEC